MVNKTYVLFFFLIFFLACNNKVSEPNQAQLSNMLNDTNIDFQNHIYTQYKIPLPLDLFKFLSKNTKFNQSILTPLEIKQKTLTVKYKAIVLGLLNADIAYCSTLNQPQIAINYFHAAQQIAKELDIETGFSDKLYQRLNQNINNQDSIKKIVNEAYWKTCNYLEAQNRNNILPFIVAAGWFESVYLLIKSEPDKIYSPQFKKIILSQEKGFCNVNKYLYNTEVESSAYHFYNDLKKISAQINYICKLYKLYKININNQKAVYNKIISQIIFYRNKLLKNNL